MLLFLADGHTVEALGGSFLRNVAAHDHARIGIRHQNHVVKFLVVVVPVDILVAVLFAGVQHGCLGIGLGGSFELFKSLSVDKCTLSHLFSILRNGERHIGSHFKLVGGVQLDENGISVVHGKFVGQRSFHMAGCQSQHAHKHRKAKNCFFHIFHKDTYFLGGFRSGAVNADRLLQ